MLDLHRGNTERNAIKAWQIMIAGKSMSLHTAISYEVRICAKLQIHFVEVLTLPSDLINGSFMEK